MHGIHVGGVPHSGGQNKAGRVHVSEDLLQHDDVLRHTVAHELAHGLEKYPAVRRETMDNENNLWGSWNQQDSKFDGKFTWGAPNEQQCEALAHYLTNFEYLKSSHPEVYTHCLELERRYPEDIAHMRRKLSDVFGEMLPDLDSVFIPTRGDVKKSVLNDKNPWRNHTTERFTELMPTEFVHSFREYDRQPGGQHHIKGSDHHYNKLRREMQEQGIREPLIMGFHPATGTAKLVEGNHRLAIARELGFTHVPVRIVRYNMPWTKEYGHPERPVPGHVIGSLTDQHGYTPGDLKPSQVFTAHQHLFSS
jgi:hypothetical protein